MAVVACSRFSVERCSTDSAEKSYSSAPLQEMAGSDRRMFPSAARMDSGGRPVATVKSPPMPVYSWMTARLQAGMPSLAGNGEMFVIHANEVTHAHQVDEHLGSIACPVESVPDGWVKVVFASDPESIRKLGQYAKTRYYGRENYFLATNSIYLEIMPSGVSKASGLHDLCALMSKSMKNTVVIGDYYNDLEIMREAGYAVAVANAPAEVKAAADHVTTCTCAEGAVGEYLYSLIGRAEGREV